MYVSVVGVPVVARLSPLACVTARGKCFARVYEIKSHGLLPKSRIFHSRPLVVVPGPGAHPLVLGHEYPGYLSARVFLERKITREQVTAHLHSDTPRFARSLQGLKLRAPYTGVQL